MFKSIKNSCKQFFRIQQLVKYSFNTINQTYDSSQHSLLQDTYIYGNKNSKDCAYILRDQKSQNFLAVNLFDYNISLTKLREITQNQDSKFSHIFLNNQNKQTIEQIKKYDQEVQIVVGEQGVNEKLSNIQYLQDIRPITIGDLCLTDDNHLIAVTQVNQQSTKIPLLFTGDMLLVSSTGSNNNMNYRQFYNSLQSIKNFPSETLIFPKFDDAYQSLLFSKSIDPKNEFIDLRISQVKQLTDQGQYMSPVTLMEEKMTNPFLRCQEKHFQSLTGEKDPFKVFVKLQKLKASMNQ